MTTTRSYSEKGRGLFQSCLRRLAPFGVATSIILFITIALPYIVAGALDEYFLTGTYEEIRQKCLRTFSGIYFGDEQSGFVMAILIIMGFACALSATRYMHSKKQTDLYHSLPVRRERLLLTNTLAAAAVILGPFLVIYAGTLIAQQALYARYGWITAAYWQYIAMDLLTILTVWWVIYALTVFVSVNVGTTFDALVVAGSFMGIPAAVYGICGALASVTLYGVTFEGEYALRLSPLLFFFERYQRDTYAEFAPVFAVWFALGCLLFGGALLCYRRRKSEIAGQTQPRGLFQMIVKCFSALCGGAMFLALFMERSLPVRLCVIVLFAAVFGLLSDLILSRSLRMVVRNLKWMALTGAVCSVLYFGLQADFIGVQRRIPAAGAIESVDISYRGRFEDEIQLENLAPNDMGWNYWDYQGSILIDPANIELARATHTALLETHFARERERAETGAFGWHGYDYYYYGGRDERLYTVRLTYHLKNGGELVRNYHDISEADYLALAALETSEEFIRQNSPLFFMDEYAARPGTRMETYASIGATAEGATRQMRLNEADLQLLLEALRTDMLAQPLDEVLYPTGPTKGYIRLNYSDPAMRDRQERYIGVPGTGIAIFPAQPYRRGEFIIDEEFRFHASGGYELCEYWVPITGGYTNTLALLEELGYASALTPNYENIHEVRIADFMGRYSFNSGQVHTLKPSGDNYYWLFDEEELNRDGFVRQIFKTREPAEIDALANRAISSMLIDAETSSRSVLLMTFLDADGDALSTQFVRVQDIPAPLRADVESYLARRYEDLQRQYEDPEA